MKHRSFHITQLAAICLLPLAQQSCSDETKTSITPPEVIPAEHTQKEPASTNETLPRTDTIDLDDSLAPEPNLGNHITPPEVSTLPDTDDMPPKITISNTLKALAATAALMNPSCNKKDPNADQPLQIVQPGLLASNNGAEAAQWKEGYNNGYKRFSEVRTRITPELTKAIEAKDLKLGSPVYIRVFKEEREVELWLQEPNKSTFKLLHTYPIAAMSGSLGPKEKEGDRQAPEGFYYVKIGQFKPNSTFHLAFNIGYPNKFDQAHERTGSFIMMHGNAVSIGCYAMTDPLIEEIYTICHAALNSGKQRYFRFHSFPFRMTKERMAEAADSEWLPFWQTLQQGYDHFEQKKTPPNVTVRGKQYILSDE